MVQHQGDKSPSGNSARAKRREFLVVFLVHCGDLSNPVMPTFKAARDWADLVCEEFSAQVAAEKAGGMAVTAWMDGLGTPQAVAKLQVGFYSYVCKPLWTAAAGMLPSCVVQLENLNNNLEQWKKEAGT
jgi:hypothetical protein